MTPVTYMCSSSPNFPVELELEWDDLGIFCQLSIHMNIKREYDHKCRNIYFFTLISVYIKGEKYIIFGGIIIFGQIKY